MAKRRVRLVDVLFHCSLIATGGCQTHDDIETFASFTDHAAEIDRCLNDPPCSYRWCEQLLPPEDQFDLSTIDRCEVVSETPEGINLEIEYTMNLNCGRRPTGFVEPRTQVSSVA